MTPDDFKRLADAHLLASEAHRDLAKAYGIAMGSAKSFESPGTFTPPKKLRTTHAVETLGRAPQAKPESEGAGGYELSKIERKILVSLAQLNRPASIVTVSIVGEFSPRSSTVDTALALLRRHALVDGPKSALRVTAAGRDAIGTYPELPRGHELFQYWQNKLGSQAGKILSALRHVGTASTEAIAMRENFSPRSSTVDTALATLKRLGFVEGPKSALRLTNEFKLAIEPGIRVFDRATGNETLVDARGNVKK